MNNKINFLKHCLNCYLRYYVNKYIFKITVIPYLAIINLTTECNLNCKFCEKLKKKESLNEIAFKKIIKELYNLKIPAITFSGGEPLMHKKAIKFFYFAKKHGFYMNLSTNGTLINNDKIAKEISFLFDSVKISLHALDNKLDYISQKKNTFLKVQKAIKLLIKNKKKNKLGLNVTITNDNLNGIEKIIKKFKNKFDSISLLPVFSFRQNLKIKPFKKNKEILKLYNYLYKNNKSFHSKDFFKNYDLNYSKKICDAGKLYITIMSDGSIQACPFIDKKNKSFFMGKITSNFNLKVILKKKQNKKFSKKCLGCYSTCTTEISELNKKNIFSIIFKNLKNNL